jgi:hypothetical protein
MIARMSPDEIARHELTRLERHGFRLYVGGSDTEVARVIDWARAMELATVIATDTEPCRIENAHGSVRWYVWPNGRLSRYPLEG